MSSGGEELTLKVNDEAEQHNGAADGQMEDFLDGTQLSCEVRLLVWY
jgi:hypothetical protein